MGVVDGQTLSGESSPIPTGGIVSAQLEHQALISTMLKVKLSMESHLRDFIDNLVSLPPSPFLLALPLCLFHQISVRLQHVDGTSCVISHVSRLHVTLSSPTTGVSSSDERDGDFWFRLKLSAAVGRISDGQTWSGDKSAHKLKLLAKETSELVQSSDLLLVGGCWWSEQMSAEKTPPGL